MKKNLLVTTALVAATISFNAAAGDIYYIGDEESLQNIENKTYAEINFDKTLNVDEAFEVVLDKDYNLTASDRVTLHDTVTLKGGNNLIVNGYLTQTASGSDISDVRVTINDNDGNKENGATAGLVLGNDLTIGKVELTEGTELWLYNDGNKKLTVKDAETGLTFRGNTTVDGNGENALNIDAKNGVVAFDAVGGTVELNKDVTIDGKATINTKTDITGSGKLTVNGYLTQTVDTVNGESNLSNIDITIGNNTNGAGLIVGNKLTVGNLSVKEGAKVNLWKGVEGDKVLTVADGKKITFEDGSALKFSIDETATTGDKIKGNVELAGKVTLDVDVSHVTSAKDPYTFIDGTVTGNGEWTHNLTNNIFNVSISDGRNALEFAAKSAEDIAASTGASSSQAAGVNAIISGGTENTGNASFEAVAGEVYDLMQSSNKADVAKALEMVDKMSSDLSNAVTASAVANNAQVLAAVGSRFTGGSVAPTQQGMSSGDSWFEKGIAWVQGLFNKSKLDTSNGFEADSEGIAFGFEKIVNGGNSKVGIGYAYTQSDIDAHSRDVDADTHTLMVYGEYKPADWFVNAVLSYSFGDYDETSSIKSASYDVDSYGLQVMGGFERVLENGAVVTPSAGFRYLHVDPDSYTDSLGSKVDADESDILTAVVGAKVAKNWELENGKVLKPEVRAALTYDLTEAEDTSVVSLANGSSYAVEGENLDRLGFEFGAGVSADVNDNWELSVGYEGKFREDYQDHSGMLNAKYKF
ncbi:MAG: autotransporter domain-containing protein [Alphaproteobacteria bacterium]|nr:autotransporter domain-containing protein [Alphaproteobacteria bacterium]